jgi:hypothetical protein
MRPIDSAHIAECEMFCDLYRRAVSDHFQLLAAIATEQWDALHDCNCTNPDQVHKAGVREKNLAKTCGILFNLRNPLRFSRLALPAGKDEGRTIRLRSVSVFVLLPRGESVRPAFTSFPSSFDYDVTSRRGKQVTIRLRLTSGATGVAPGPERGDTARFPQC